METLTLALFCAVLVGCICFDISILYALAAGLAIFCAYALKRGFSLKETLSMCADGVLTAKNILITFLLIGVLTALWRSAGTIPVIVCYAGALIRPSVFLVMTFLLNCMVSVLTGTAFGTAATMGVICAAMGRAMQISPVLIGGAVLSGVFFGDRCSPVSTSALLVSELTGTDIFNNIRRMIRTAAVPFVLTCIVYTLLGFAAPHADADFDLAGIFAPVFRLHWAALLPAAVILALSAFRVPVKKAMLASIVCAVPLCLFLQDVPLGELLKETVTGYETDDPQVAAMLSGGGIVSMLKVSAIVCISSAYSGIFRRTGMLGGLQNTVLSAGKKITPFGAMLLTSFATGAVACNQTLSIMLTKQLCEDAQPDKSDFALGLEDTAVVTSALIPWSIAGGVPLSSVGAPETSILCACFLYLLPLCSFVRSLCVEKRTKFQKTPNR